MRYKGFTKMSKARTRSPDIKTAKERHTETLLSFMGNPDNKFPSRSEMAMEILKYNDVSAMYKIFATVDLSEIENEALELRKKYSAGNRAKVYDALIKAAGEGNVQAIKEYLDRTEGKTTDKQELTGKDGGPLSLSLGDVLDAIDGNSKGIIDAT